MGKYVWEKDLVIGGRNFSNNNGKGGDIMEEIPKLAVELPRMVYCKHGLLEQCCGVCTKHPHSVAVKGGHVPGSSKSGSSYVINPWAGQNNNSGSYFDF